MNFFRRLRKTNVTVLDDTATNVETVANSSGRSSSGLRRSGAISASNGYHDSETKLFVEAPIASSEKTLVKPKNESANQGYTHADQVEMAASAAVRIHPEAIHNEPSHSATDHFSLHNNNYEDQNRTQTSQQSAQEPLDQNKVNKLMELYAAIIRGEKSEVKKILTVNQDLLEAPDNFGRTPLMYCVLADRLECAKLLLKMKCKLDQVDKAGRSALHLAAHKASYKFLELLHDRGGNIEMKDNDGQTPLHLTTRNRHARCLDFLLKRLSPGMVDVTDQQNRTALHWSAAFSNADYVKQLIKHNSNIAMPDAEGKTPLHWAANTHDHSAVATMKAILDNASSVLNWQDYDGRTALHFAVAHENVAAVEYLLKFQQETCEVDRLDNSFRTPLHWAAQLGNTQIAKLLLSVGAKNSITDSNGATPLLYAALNNHSDVALEMIKHEVSILEQADIEGRSALMWAAGKGATDIIQTLLVLNDPAASVEKKFDDEALEFLKATSKTIHEDSKLKQAVDVNRTDNKGNTALHMASWNGHAHSSEILLRNKARHDLQNHMNHTPLFGACEKGHLNVVKHILDYNASIHLTDHEERSPLHWAALGGHAEVCDLLIKKGLDPDLRDSYQRSPLHCAAFGGFINCMNLLLENGANVDLQDKEGLSALHWAAQSGQLDATKLLFQCSAFPNLMEFTEERLTPLDHALLNERDEVAQYLIEQGALSSETIRDIAAARIQACYRGFRVRKDLLTKKNLLMKHAMLTKKNKGKRRPNNAESFDHLVGVNEEIVPKSPNADSAFADSVYSGEGSRQDQSEDNAFPAQTIHSSACPVKKIEATEKTGISPGASEVSLESEFTHGQQNEDPVLHQAPEMTIKKQSNPPTPTQPEENTPATQKTPETQNQLEEGAKSEENSEVSEPKTVGEEEAIPNNEDQQKQEEPERQQPLPLVEIKPAVLSVDPSSDDMLITDGYMTPHDAAGSCKDHGEAMVEANAVEDTSQDTINASSAQDGETTTGPQHVIQDENEMTDVIPSSPPTDAPPMHRSTVTDTSAKETTEEVIRAPKKPKRKKKHKQRPLPTPDTETTQNTEVPVQVKTEEPSENADKATDVTVHAVDDGDAVNKEMASELEGFAVEPVNTEVIAKSGNPENEAMPDNDTGKDTPRKYNVNRDQSPNAEGGDRIQNNIEDQSAELAFKETSQPKAVSTQTVETPINGTSHMQNHPGEENVEIPFTPVLPSQARAVSTQTVEKQKASVVFEDPKIETVQPTVSAEYTEHKSKKRKDHKKKRRSRKESNDLTQLPSKTRDTENSKNESITKHKVLVCAVKSAESQIDPLHDSGMWNAATDPNSELLFSEYIESLMSLSPGERKALAALQRNRKYAFERANAAATTIQKAWRRYYATKHPKRKTRKVKKSVKVKPVPEPNLNPKPPPDTSARPQTLNYQVTRVSLQSASNTPMSDTANSSTAAPDPQEPKFSVRVSKKRRPHTSYIKPSAQDKVWPCDGAMEGDVIADELKQDQRVNDTVMMYPSVTRKSKKSRPKTEHRLSRQSKLLYPQVDVSDDKLEELCRIYGQTLVLQDMYYPTAEPRPSKSRFRTVPAPSTRPKTSRAATSNYKYNKYEDEYNFMESVHVHDPITAVQTLDWRSENKKMQRNGSVKKSKAGRSSRAKKYRFQESEVAKMPVQWQKIYSELKRGPVQKATSSVPTRFSYNMRSSNY